RAAALPGLALALALATRAAVAQPPPVSTGTARADDDGTAAARAAHLRGIAARKRGDFAAAYENFLSAWQKKRHWEIALNLGEAEMKLGKYEDAVQHLTFALSDPGFSARSPDLVTKEREEVSGWIEEASSRVTPSTQTAPSTASAVSAIPSGEPAATGTAN